MSIVSYTNDFDVEFTPNGELVILDLDMAWEDMLEAMGGERSKARVLHEDYKENPLEIFNVVGLKDVSRLEMLTIGRAFYEEIVRLSGVTEIEGCDMTAVGKAIYEATTQESSFKLSEVRSSVEQCGRTTLITHQRQRETPGTWYGFLSFSSPQFAVVRAATYLGRLADHLLEGARSYWEERGRTVAREKMIDVYSAIADLTDSMHERPEMTQWRPGDLPIPQAFVTDAKKHMVGAAVRAVDELRALLGYAGEPPELE